MFEALKRLWCLGFHFTYEVETMISNKGYPIMITERCFCGVIRSRRYCLKVNKRTQFYE